MKQEFALDLGGPKRLKVTYPWNLANAEVFFDGQKILSFATKAEFQRGTTCKLTDGSVLSVLFGPVAGAPLMKGVHIIRNGAPLLASAADPVPKWAWVFIIACALIPVISVGGAVPAGLAGAGISATLLVARLSRWSIAKRVGACSLITLACWGSFGLLINAWIICATPWWKSRTAPQISFSPGTPISRSASVTDTLGRSRRSRH